MRCVPTALLAPRALTVAHGIQHPALARHSRLLCSTCSQVGLQPQQKGVLGCLAGLIPRTVKDGQNHLDDLVGGRSG